MVDNHKVIIVLPAFNAASTLRKTVNEILHDFIDEIILTDDASNDETLLLAEQMGIDHIIKHDENQGYGANQKTCYKSALKYNADVVVMLHPDYQYRPKLIPSMVLLITKDIYDVVLGSRILSKGAIKGGMPIYKYLINRILTFIQNILLQQKLSEYHTGYRCYHKRVLERIDFESNSDDFIFDNEILAQIIHYKFRIGEISCPTNYDSHSSSIKFGSAIIYGLGVLRVSFFFFLNKIGVFRSKLFRAP